jgi:hypothetical protein
MGKEGTVIYTKYIGPEKDKYELVESLKQQALKGTLICYEDAGREKSNGPNWKEISKVEVLIEIGKGTPIFVLNDKRLWVKGEL